MTGQNIICFARDWSEDPTSNNHVMRRLAQENRVLWLNSVATRSPRLTSRRDLGKIGKKLAGFLRGPQKAAENLWVYTPLVLPFPHSRLATLVNRWLLQLTLAWLRWRLEMLRFQLWTFLPNVGPYVGHLGESLSVYYCTDEWSGFTYVDGAKIAEAEAALCRKADLVFTTAYGLLERKRQYNPETYLALHGVDYPLFASALAEQTPIPDDVANLPAPVIGFYGTVHDWIDFDLIAYLAERHPDWSFVFIGQVFVDISRFQRLPNVHFLGRRPHAELPRYCKRFAVGIIPYLAAGRILDVNPLKLREYLCAGLPVVSTPVPEVMRYADVCAIAHNHAEFEQEIEAALRADTPERRVARSQAMQSETWEQKVADLGAQIHRTLAKRPPATRPRLARNQNG
jgi:glycosyltransferase involved in cell wall biosynthesis